MRIAIFGLGYVGSVTAGCLARHGHQIVGVDRDLQKVTEIASGRSPVSEPGLEALIADGVESGRIGATASASDAVRLTDMAMVCVGTPSGGNGSQSLAAIEDVSREIGRAIQRAGRYYGIVVRSTCLPGTVDKLGSWVAGAGALKPEMDFGVAANPEFLREGTAVSDFEDPPFTLIGSHSERLRAMLRELYGFTSSRIYEVDVKIAEAVKLACNAFHAAKITYANEIGRLMRSFGIDGREVMRVLCADRKLNLSEKYLIPGFSYGGSCLPKDVRALVYAARHADIPVPLLESLALSNQVPVDAVVERVLQHGRPPTALLGLTFKSHTDDMRESPYVRVAERLIGRGVPLQIVDPDVLWSRVRGANRRFVETELPHVTSLLVEDVEKLGPFKIAIVAKVVPDIAKLIEKLPADGLVIDLLGDDELRDSVRGKCAYEGVAW
jgi:GDP-mannose 6-dehydrogenase